MNGYLEEKVITHKTYASGNIIPGSEQYKIIGQKPCHRCKSGLITVNYYEPDYTPSEPSENREEKKKGGCFITTATCSALNKGDNCCELDTFQSFRDNWLLKQNSGENLVQEYYQIAPKIVRKIDMFPNQ